jgi:hypothetical protein
MVSRATSVLSDDSVVWTSGDSDRTVTVSSTPPGSMLIVRLMSVPTVSRMPGRLTGLNPFSSARTDRQAGEQKEAAVGRHGLVTHAGFLVEGHDRDARSECAGSVLDESGDAAGAGLGQSG